MKGLRRAPGAEWLRNADFLRLANHPRTTREPSGIPGSGRPPRSPGDRREGGASGGLPATGLLPRQVVRERCGPERAGDPVAGRGGPGTDPRDDEGEAGGAVPPGTAGSGVAAGPWAPRRRWEHRRAIRVGWTARRWNGGRCRSTAGREGRPDEAGFAAGTDQSRPVDRQLPGAPEARDAVPSGVDGGRITDPEGIEPSPRAQTATRNDRRPAAMRSGRRPAVKTPAVCDRRENSPRSSLAPARHRSGAGRSRGRKTGPVRCRSTRVPDFPVKAREQDDERTVNPVRRTGVRPGATRRRPRREGPFVRPRPGPGPVPESLRENDEKHARAPGSDESPPRATAARRPAAPPGTTPAATARRPPPPPGRSRRIPAVPGRTRKDPGRIPKGRRGPRSPA